MATARISKSASNPLTLTILDSLSADWQSYQEFIRKMAELVPGEIAFRTAEKQRSYYKYVPSEEETSKLRNKDTTSIILSGSRTYVRKLIHALRRSGRVEIEYEQVEVYNRAVRIRLSDDEIALRQKEKNATSTR